MNFNSKIEAPRTLLHKFYSTLFTRLCHQFSTALIQGEQISVARNRKYEPQITFAHGIIHESCLQYLRSTLREMLERTTKYRIGFKRIFESKWTWALLNRPWRKTKKSYLLPRELKIIAWKRFAWFTIRLRQIKPSS